MFFSFSSELLTIFFPLLFSVVAPIIPSSISVCWSSEGVGVFSLLLKGGHPKAKLFWAAGGATFSQLESSEAEEIGDDGQRELKSVCALERSESPLNSTKKQLEGQKNICRTSIYQSYLIITFIITCDQKLRQIVSKYYQLMFAGYVKCRISSHSHISFNQFFFFLTETTAAVADAETEGIEFIDEKVEEENDSSDRDKETTSGPEEDSDKENEDDPKPLHINRVNLRAVCRENERARLRVCVEITHPALKLPVYRTWTGELPHLQM